MVYGMNGAFGSYRLAQFFVFARYAREDLAHGYVTRNYDE